MSLERKLIKKACKVFWEIFHEKIEEKGYFLSKDSFIQGPESYSIFAGIGNNCPEDLLNSFRKIIPKEFVYKENNQNRNYPVIVGPSLSDLMQI